METTYSTPETVPLCQLPAGQPPHDSDVVSGLTHYKECDDIPSSLATSTHSKLSVAGILQASLG